MSTMRFATTSTSTFSPQVASQMRQNVKRVDLDEGARAPSLHAAKPRGASLPALAPLGRELRARVSESWVIVLALQRDAEVRDVRRETRMQRLRGEAPVLGRVLVRAELA